MDYRPTLFELPSDDTWPGDGNYPPYLFTEDIAVAVDVALATKRPLLIAGPPGSIYSMLAPAMAGLGIRGGDTDEDKQKNAGCRFLPHIFTSRSRLGELAGDLDHLRRLNDAQTRIPGDERPLPPEWAYREPGKFWWAFEPESARRRGADKEKIRKLGDQFQEPEIPEGAGEAGDIVMLLDEIDKAEPDLPNDLLEPLDRLRFQVPARPEVRAPADMKVLVIITTNGERDLPPAFLRRCVSLVLRHPTHARLIEIGEHHFPKIDPGVLKKVADRFVKVRRQAYEEGMRLPSTSEFLDAVRATKELPLAATDNVWGYVESASLLKHTDWADALPDED